MRTAVCGQTLPMAATDTEHVEDGLDQARVPKGGRRDKLRSNPATRLPYRVGVFVAGLLFVGLGVALAVLPGPLTIPPVLLGLWIWSWEFRFAQKLFESFAEKGREAWEHAKRKPVSSTALTLLGLAGAGAMMWAVVHFDLVAEAKQAAGL